ncbi:MAG: hypothetical protein ABI832_22315 [bacterium]
MPHSTPFRSAHHRPRPGADVTASAALAICESLLLALNDRKVLPESEILGILRDAAAAHADNDGEESQQVHHKEVAALINRIIDSGNSVRHK